MSDLPSPDQILEWIRDNPGQSGKREIARAFGLKGAAKIELKRLLRDMARDGLIEKKRRRAYPAGELPPVLVLRVTGPDRSGDLWAEPAQWEDASAPPPRVLILPGKDAPALGAGDRLLGRLTALEGPDAPLAARVIRRIGMGPKRLLGIYHDSEGGGRIAANEPTRLRGAAGWIAAFFCAVPVFVGFLVPVGILASMAVDSGQSILDSRYLRFAHNSLLLAGVAALFTVAGAILVSFRARMVPGRTSRGLLLAAGLGYAVPGGVIAVGILVPAAGLDNLVDGWTRDAFGVSTGLILTGSIWLLVLAYVARFMAVALNTYDSGLATVGPHMDAVARTLGRNPPRVLTSVHFPILKGSVLTALLIVFVDVMKELPATMIMRPFNFDTLAVQAHRLAADERLDQAAVPSLAIAAIGLLPVILVCRRLAARRPGLRPAALAERPAG